MLQFDSCLTRPFNSQVSANQFGCRLATEAALGRFQDRIDKRSTSSAKYLPLRNRNAALGDGINSEPSLECFQKRCTKRPLLRLCSSGPEVVALVQPAAENTRTEKKQRRIHRSASFLRVVRRHSRPAVGRTSKSLPFCWRWPSIEKFAEHTSTTGKRASSGRGN